MPDDAIFGSLAPPDRLIRPPRNPARMPAGVEDLAAELTVNPLWDVAQGVGAAASGYGTSPEAGAGIMGAIGLMTPGARLGRVVPPRAANAVTRAPSQFDDALRSVGNADK